MTYTIQWIPETEDDVMLKMFLSTHKSRENHSLKL